MTLSPAVSVILPVRGDGRYLEEAIVSIRSQSLVDLELFVVDNGLTSEGLDILRRAIGDDARIRVIRQAGGLSRCLDVACGLARSPLIARIDGDDVALPDRLERQLAHMRTHEDCVACGTWVMLMDASGRDMELKKGPVTAEASRQLLQKWPCIIHPTAMFRKQVYEAAGGYSIWYRAAEDYALWVRMAARGDIVNLPFVGLRRRIHPESVTTRLFGRQMITTTKVRAEARSLFHDGKPYERVRLREAVDVLGIGRSRFAYEMAKWSLRQARMVRAADFGGADRRNAVRWMGRARAPALWPVFAIYYLRSFRPKPQRA